LVAMGGVITPAANPTDSPCDELCGSGNCLAFVLGGGYRHQLRCQLDLGLSPKPLRVAAVYKKLAMGA
jgi:hypothetical protein